MQQIIDNSILERCKTTITAWQKAFNNQDAAGCAAQYEEGAVMHAKPFGTFTGRDQIRAFWQNIIDEGYADVEYTDVDWRPKGNDGYLLSSNWTMNKAYGVVHCEHWKLQADGNALLHEDVFEVLGERSDIKL